MKFVLLVVAYAVLFLLYALQFRTPTVTKWPVIAPLHNQPYASSYDTCTDSSDCPSHHVCYNRECYPVLRTGDDMCNPLTGKWVIEPHRGQDVAVCTCLDHSRVSQKHYGGNCDVYLACEPHGRYDPVTQKCQCAPGYMPTPQPSCVPMQQSTRCDAPNQVKPQDVKQSDGFGIIDPTKPCLTRPCTFDVFTGQPLTGGHFEPGMGCVCDPTLGLFGVRLTNHPDYVAGDGYNACASVFKTPLQTPISICIYAYFYLSAQTPVVTFLQFSIKTPDDVIEQLRGTVEDNCLQIRQEFPYDYMQYFFHKGKDFEAFTLSADAVDTMYVPVRGGLKYRKNHMEWCKYVTRHVRYGDGLFYAVQHQFPVCYVGKLDTDSPERYRGRFVSNPLHMLDEGEHLSNGIEMYFNEDYWRIAFTGDYKLEQFRQIAEVPKVDDRVVQSINKRFPPNGSIEFVQHQYEQRPREKDEPIFLP